MKKLVHLLSLAFIAALLPVAVNQTHAAEEGEARFRAMTPAELREYEFDVMRRIADLALIPPRLNTSPLPNYDYDRLDYGMTIGIERTPKGRLWACWVAGGDSPKAFFVLATSDDDGETWSKPRLVVDAHSKNLPMDRSVLVGNLWTDPLGRLWLIFDQSMDMFDGRAGVWMAALRESRRRAARVVRAAANLARRHAEQADGALDRRVDAAHFARPARGLRPVQGAVQGARPVSRRERLRFHRPGRDLAAARRVRFPNPDWHEHMIVERKDGSLWMLARTAKGIMQTTSTDGGRTWAEPSEPPGIRQPNARFHVRRLASDRLLLVKHGDAADTHQGRVQAQRVALGRRRHNLARRADPRRSQRRLLSRRLPGARRHDLHLLRPQPRHRRRDPSGPLHRRRRAGQESSSAPNRSSRCSSAARWAPKKAGPPR